MKKRTAFFLLCLILLNTAVYAESELYTSSDGIYIRKVVFLCCKKQSELYIAMLRS